MVDVGAFAEVLERAALVNADDGVVGQVVYELDLVLLAFVGEMFERLGAGELDALELVRRADEVLHLLLYGLEVLGHEVVLQVEVVVEAVVDGGADAELDAREELLYGGGHDVGQRMADTVQVIFAVKFFVLF